VGDYLSGPYLVFATFFLIPVAVVAWFCGRRLALVIAALASACGVVSTALDPQSVAPAVYLANGFLRFVMYAIVAVVVAAQRDAVETIHDLAATDPLTGLLNRRAFYEEARRELYRAQREGRPLALAYIDVDELKARNDTYGHEAGDAMIVEFASAARRTFRASDLVARVGGDEFVVLLVDTDQLRAAEIVDRLRETLEASELTPIRFSAGIASGRVGSEVDVEAIVHAADVLMIEAKAHGKSRSVSRDELVARS